MNTAPGTRELEACKRVAPYARYPADKAAISNIGAGSKQQPVAALGLSCRARLRC